MHRSEPGADQAANVLPAPAWTIVVVTVPAVVNAKPATRKHLQESAFWFRVLQEVIAGRAAAMALFAAACATDSKGGPAPIHAEAPDVASGTIAVTATALAFAAVWTMIAMGSHSRPQTASCSGQIGVDRVEAGR